MERSDPGTAQLENVQLRKDSRAGSATPINREQASNVQRSTKSSLQEVFTILHKWGIHTVGQLAALDKEELAARLGPEAIRLWARANGQSTRLLKLVRPPESFQENFEFENEIETAEPLLFMLRRFLEQLAVRLGAMYLVAKELTLQITFANSRREEPAADGKQVYERVFKIPQPTNNVDLLFRMLQTHLENFRSKYPIIAVALTAEPVKPAGEQFGLFETTIRNPHQLAETLARLTALLGSDRIGTPVLEETHRPDAFRMQPFSWHGLPAHHIGKMPMLRAALRRFRPAVSASVLQDENAPTHIRSAHISGKIIQQRGPYLLSGNWWDETTWARAEWDVELENGELARAHEHGGVWKIDGIYD